MSCAACGAAAATNPKRDYCPICGLAQQKGAPRAWNRDVEAAAYEDLSSILDSDEALLGVSRGRIVGSWKPKAGFNPRAHFTPFVNLGLTGSRLIVQPISQSDGRAISGSASSYPLSAVVAMAKSDADVLEPGRTLRLQIQTATGDSMRIKMSGRMAESASEIVEVWQSLYREHAGAEAPAGIPCPGCGRELDRPYRFCPFCGKEQEVSE